MIQSSSDDADWVHTKSTLGSEDHTLLGKCRGQILSILKAQPVSIVSSDIMEGSRIIVLSLQMLGTLCTSVPRLGSLTSLLCWNPELSTPRGSFSVCSSSTRWLEASRTGWWFGSRWMMAQASSVRWRKFTPSTVGYFLRWLNVFHPGKHYLSMQCFYNPEQFTWALFLIWFWCCDSS